MQNIFLDWLLYWYLYQYNLPSIPTVLATIFVWFVSSEFRCFWLVAGNIYVSLMWRKGGWCVGWGWWIDCQRVVWEDCIKCLKKGWNGKRSCVNKNFKKNAGMLGKRVSALKRGLWLPYKLWTLGCPLTNIGSYLGDSFEHSMLITAISFKV